MPLMHDPKQVDEGGWSRVVFGEVIVPGIPNVYADVHSEESVRNFAYGFMLNGFRFDKEHDNNSLDSRVQVVESFIARDGDPDFIKGSWVLGVRINDDELWQDVLNGNLNGFSYQAVVRMFGVDLEGESSLFRRGVTQPSLEDGHTHVFYAMLDEDGRVITGSTTNTNGHEHELQKAVITEMAEGHRHIYQLL